MICARCRTQIHHGEWFITTGGQNPRHAVCPTIRPADPTEPQPVPGAESHDSGTEA